LLIDLVDRHLPKALIAHFEFRALSPIFDTADFTVCGTPEPDAKTIHLRAKGPNGELAMTAVALLG
jgi:3-methylfumaryl-CoA hydratase